MPLCSDHSRGRTPRYEGTNPPRVNCSGCWSIWESRNKRDESPVPEVVVDQFKGFSKLDPAEKRSVLRGETGLKIVMFDLECTNLKPNVGRILCCSFKPLGQEAYTFSGLERRFMDRDVYNDGALSIAIRDELETYDIIAGWNSKMFDTRFLNSRVLRAGGRTKRAQHQIDGMWSFRSKYNAWSGLDSVQKFARPDADTEKTSVAWDQWMRALGWDKDLREEAMAEIVDHCERDVIVLEDIYLALVDADVFRGIRRDGGVL